MSPRKASKQQSERTTPSGYFDVSESQCHDAGGDEFDDNSTNSGRCCFFSSALGALKALQPGTHRASFVRTL